MLKNPFSKEPDYVYSVQGLHRLHALFAAGKGQTPEADELRDTLDEPWTHLSEIERERINGLSADLYSLTDPPEPPLPMNPQAEKNLADAIKACEAGEWDRALGLLRRWSRYVEPARLSVLRGKIWIGAGDATTAALFFDHASRLEPENAAYASSYLYALDQSQPGGRLEHAEAILKADEAYPPEVVVQAATSWLARSKGVSIADTPPGFGETTRILERALDRIEKAGQPRSSFSSRMQGSAVALLGHCYRILGDTERAIHYYNQGLAVNPNDDALRVARGILQYGTEPSAIEDFQIAVRHGHDMVWPYFYLAHHYLITRQFEECRKECERAVTMPNDSKTVQSCLYEWLAVSLAELESPASQVRDAFVKAIQLAPQNDRARRNYQVFEDYSNRGSVGVPWEQVSESVAREVGLAEYHPKRAA